MKMRKLLASGVAATVAVTSLASVASAAEKTFDMAYPNAGWNGNVQISTDIAKSVGASAFQDSQQVLEIKLGSWNGMVEWDGAEKEVKDKDGNSVDVWESPATWNGDIKLVVKGYKIDDEGKSTSVTKEYKMDYNSTSQIASIVVLPDSVPTYVDGEFAPAYFDIIETVEVSFPFAGGTTKEEGYNHYKNNTVPFNIGNAKVYNMTGAKKTGLAGNYAINTGAGLKNAIAKGLLDAEIAKGETGNTAAATLAYAITNGGYSHSKDKYLEASVSRSINVNKEYPFIAAVATGDNNTILRHDVQLLSDADEYYAKTNAIGAWYIKRDYKEVEKTALNGTKFMVEEWTILDEFYEWKLASDDDQTYDDNHQGTEPNMFAGLASQMADFFNKQTNGTVTFKFQTNTSSSGSDWFTGGIPSTEVGIKNFLGDASTNDFALFVNYASSTGSLQALTSIDAASGTVTFDISDILDAMGGQTIGVIEDISFGLAKGVGTKEVDTYEMDKNGDYVKKLNDDGSDFKTKISGLYVESVTLAYDEDADVEADIEDNTDETPDIEIEDETTNVEIEDDTPEDEDSDAAGDVVVEDEDDDANPGTGVALAVVPAMVAAAAVVLSKKRK